MEAIKVADIPTELDKQIQVLQRSASEHNMRQDEQLQRVKELRSKPDDGLASLALSLEKVRDVTTTDVATKAGQQAQLDASKDLQSDVLQLSAALETGTKEIKESMKVQNDLILVIKTFLEEKAAIQERAMAEAEAEVSVDSSDEKVESSAWPSATLPAAHLAITLLSTVVSSVTAVSVVRQSQNARKPTPMSPSRVPGVPRTVSSATSNSTISKTKISSELSSPSRASTWVSDFSSSTGYGQKLSTPQLIRNGLASTPVSSGFYHAAPTSSHAGNSHHLGGGNTGWSKKISKLDDSDSDSGGRKKKERPRHYPDSTYLDSPAPILPHYPVSNYFDSLGPVLPPSSNGLHAGSGHGRHSRTHHKGHNSGDSGGYSDGHSGNYY